MVWRKGAPQRIDLFFNRDLFIHEKGEEMLHKESCLSHFRSCRVFSSPLRSVFSRNVTRGPIWRMSYIQLLHCIDIMDDDRRRRRRKKTFSHQFFYLLLL